ncbi:Lsr2 family protein [Paenibacillus sp. TRM 82003]|uniref:histone-like nucleoid-structuring protein Lsr2 n=1 Tax=Kineococcus sp. TRM81007 TaxID=2925831 RepID=UPI001F5B0056|nr:Lsr2 family protein [Kineococcus sp. TRM81007]MCI2240237.1 Lsr2 family protein [Kineococcus sp. TRM81007]MCI3927585.1 Lsr2 family protein [Paenibacillus sp. TRM 82003]
MAQRTTVVLTDDVDGGEASETVRFGVEGDHYEIDLNTENAEKLRRALSLYVEHGRRVGGRRSSSAPAGSAAGGSAASRSAGDGVDGAAVRAWARENGIEVSDRGRIKSEVVEQYRRAVG